MITISGGMLAFFLWFLLRHFRPAEAWYDCHGCGGPVRFDPKSGHFLHADGRQEATNDPIETWDPTDDASEPLQHLASPINYP